MKSAETCAELMNGIEELGLESIQSLILNFS